MSKVDDAQIYKISDSVQTPVQKISPSSARTFYRAAGKRLFDLFFTLMILPVVGPVIVILALVVMRDGKAPFFGHLRVGKDGKSFRCWKIRSMVPDAKARLAAHLAANPEARAEWNATFKLENDPRITRIGRILRKSSLDELPQIWNILKGEMSLVGPRPVIEDELKLYGPALKDYQSLRPGLTGLWQVSGRNDVSYEERVALDVKYARKLSFPLDIKIIFATALAVLNRTGK